MTFGPGSTAGAGGFSSAGESAIGAFGGGGPAAAGSAGGSLLKDAGKSLVSLVSDTLGVDAKTAAQLIGGLGSTAISTIIDKLNPGGTASGAAKDANNTNQANYWNNVHLQTPNQTNAYGDTSEWVIDPATGKYTQTQKFSAPRQEQYNAQQGIATSNAQTAQGMDMTGYGDPNSYYANVVKNNLFGKPKPSPSMGGDLLGSNTLGG